MFTWDGMYLMYKGDFDGAQMMMDVCPDAHPSWEGKLKPAFVARFKYRKPYKTWMKFLIKHATVEEYMTLQKKLLRWMQCVNLVTKEPPNEIH